VDRGWTPGRGARSRVALVCAASVALGGCLGEGGGDEPHVVKGDVATVYTSVPSHGVSLSDAEQVLAGERRALEHRHGRAGGFRIRLSELPATDDREHPWDPGLVAANANRAADDPTAIAYLGELDYGATAVSLPITNDAGLLQVSPLDGLTSLTQRPPGRPRAGPERYYPSGSRSFVRIGPTDLSEARAIVERLKDADATRIGIVFDREIYGRELAAQVAELARDEGLMPVALQEYRGQVDGIPDIVRQLADARPDAVVELSVAGRGTIPMFVSIDAALPGVPVYATSGMLALPELSVPPGPEHIEAFGPVLGPERAGFDAMRLVLDAIDAGRRDRRSVIAAGLRLGKTLPTRRIALYEPDEHGRFRRSQARFSPR
jgi:branched-chain amino acid transport system substrate-binding protein